MEGEIPACDVDRSWPYHRSSFASHGRADDALDRYLGSNARRVRRETHSLRYSGDTHPATTPVTLASIPEACGITTADRERRRPRRSDQPARAELPGSINELHPRCWTAHSASYGGFYTSLHHRAIFDGSQGEFKLKLSIPHFDGDFSVEDYLDWEQEVDNFFYHTYIPQERQVRYVVRKLKGRAGVWWTHMVRARQLDGRREIQTWVKMKRLLREQFLSPEYELNLNHQFTHVDYHSSIDGCKSNLTVVNASGFDSTKIPSSELKDDHIEFIRPYAAHPSTITETKTSSGELNVSSRDFEIVETESELLILEAKSAEDINSAFKQAAVEDLATSVVDADNLSELFVVNARSAKEPSADIVIRDHPIEAGYSFVEDIDEEIMLEIVKLYSAEGQHSALEGFKACLGKFHPLLIAVAQNHSWQLTFPPKPGWGGSQELGYSSQHSSLQKVAELAHRRYLLQRDDHETASTRTNIADGSGDATEFGADIAFKFLVYSLVDVLLENDVIFVGDDFVSVISHEGQHLMQAHHALNAKRKDVKEVQAETSSIVQRINETYSNSNYKPVILINKPLPFYEKVVYYVAADCCFITVFWDVMNLIPYEYITARQGDENLDRVLGLSTVSGKKIMFVLLEFIGCSPSLSGAIRVNSWDIDAVVEAMDSAWEMPETEKQLRHEKHYPYGSPHDVSYWVHRFLQDLERFDGDHLTRRCWGIGVGLGFEVVAVENNFRKLSMEYILTAYQKAKTRAVLLDYDGALMPQSTIDRRSSSKLFEILNTLCNDKNNLVFLVSAKSRSTLSYWFGNLENLAMAAEHGYFLRVMRDAMISVCVCGLKVYVAPKLHEIKPDFRDGHFCTRKFRLCMWLQSQDGAHTFVLQIFELESSSFEEKGI